MTLHVLTALAAAAVLAPAPAADDAAETAPEETILVLEFEVMDHGVNAGDDSEVAAVAHEATRLFREQVRADGRFVLAEADAADGAAAPGGSSSRGYACRTVACTREVARRAGATRVVRGKYVKVSNLIRYLAVELVDPATGRVLRSAAAEVKGQRDVILPRAVASLYDRLHPSTAGQEAGVSRSGR